VDDEPEFYLPVSWRKRPDGSVKQGSSNETVDRSYFCEKYTPEFVVDYSLRMYNEMIEGGVAPEQARMILPQNTMTEWIWSGSLAAFARVVRLRTDPHAQLETQEIAKQINNLVSQEFQHSWKALLG
jgi:thymidylate synthase (FAD)